MKAGRYAPARQYQRMRRCLRKLRTLRATEEGARRPPLRGGTTGRLIRDIRRKASHPDEALATLLARADRVRQQQPHDTHKLYSLHEPEVQCISKGKGKAHKRYEFGQKVAVAGTNRGNWMVAARMLPDNPCDGHTLAETLTAVQAVTGVAVTDAYVDKGYRGHGCTEAVNVHLPGQRSGGSPAERRRRRRRSAIEPKIGHLKSDPFAAQGKHRMDRCFLAGLAGDAINAVLAAAASNLRKPLRQLAAALLRRLEFAIGTPQPPSLLCLSG